MWVILRSDPPQSRSQQRTKAARDWFWWPFGPSAGWSGKVGQARKGRDTWKEQIDYIPIVPPCRAIFVVPLDDGVSGHYFQSSP
jgi:hypothetical protein